MLDENVFSRSSAHGTGFGGERNAKLLNVPVERRWLAAVSPMGPESWCMNTMPRGLENMADVRGRLMSKSTIGMSVSAKPQRSGSMSGMLTIMPSIRASPPQHDLISAAVEASLMFQDLPSPM